MPAPLAAADGMPRAQIEIFAASYRIAVNNVLAEGIHWEHCVHRVRTVLHSIYLSSQRSPWNQGPAVWRETCVRKVIRGTLVNSAFG